MFSTILKRGDDLANQLQQILNGVVSGPVISQYDYTYNQVGSRLTMATSGAPGAQNFNYTYDNIDQLTAVSGSQSHTYNYDKVHNRTSADEGDPDFSPGEIKGWYDEWINQGRPRS
jgi:hypothetical protein